MTQETLCTTLAGNDCPVVTITAPEDEGSPLHERKGAFFTGGVLPRSCCAVLSMGLCYQQAPASTRLPVLSCLLDALGCQGCWLSALHPSSLLALTAAPHVLQQEYIQGSPTPPG